MSKSRANTNTNEGELFIVEKILDRQKFGKVIKYKIKWQGYPEKYSTWEPMDNLQEVVDMVEDFDSQFQDRDAIKKSKPIKNKNDVSVLTGRKRKPEEVKLSSDEEVDDAGFEMEKTSVRGKKNLAKSALAITNKIPIEADSSNSDYNNAPQGKFETDKPSKIITGKQHDDNEYEIICLVEWKKRADGRIPKPTYYTNAELKERCPNLLIEFYESRLKFPPNKKKIQNS
jgi:hypothetical protein